MRWLPDFLVHAATTWFRPRHATYHTLAPAAAANAPLFLRLDRHPDVPVPVTWLDPVHGTNVPFSPDAIPLVRCVPPEPVQPGTPPLVYTHGNGEDLGTCYDTCCALARRYRRDVWCWDYPGYGTNTQEPTEHRLNTALVAVLQFLAKEHGIHGPVVFGRSLGTAPSVYAATADAPAPPVGALILHAPFRSLVATQLPFTAPTWCDAMCSGRRLKRCTVPTLLVHGTADHVVPVRNTRTLAATCPCVRDVVLVPGAGHNNLHAYADTLIAPATRAFLAATVDPAPTATRVKETHSAGAGVGGVAAVAAVATGGR
ncbi:MAG: hypothetical protein CMQ41_14125 [Gammaproteobacteria bacterium]|nr:hypothetical protein [Gammaproteobacteria bacterium]